MSLIHRRLGPGLVSKGFFAALATAIRGELKRLLSRVTTSVELVSRVDIARELLSSTDLSRECISQIGDLQR